MKHSKSLRKDDCCDTSCQDMALPYALSVWQAIPASITSTDELFLLPVCLRFGRISYHKHSPKWSKINEPHISVQNHTRAEWVDRNAVSISSHDQYVTMPKLPNPRQLLTWAAATFAAYQVESNLRLLMNEDRTHYDLRSQSEQCPSSVRPTKCWS